MEKVIIYPNEAAVGGVSVIVPAPSARERVLVSAAVYQEAYTTAHVKIGVDPETNEDIFEDRDVRLPDELVTPEVSREETDEEFLTRIAEKDVPAGKPFLIIDRAAVPQDDARATWKTDFSEPDGVGAA